jgi:uncharacterized repeat protein (TIGR03803 family)
MMKIESLPATTTQVANSARWTKMIEARCCASALVLAAVFVIAVIATPLAKAQTFTVLHAFAGSPDGRESDAALINVNGNLYGTTRFGGISDKGTMFKVNSKGGEIVLHSFRGGYPLSALVVDSAGNFYGTTSYGGTSNFGTVFKMDTTGAETVLYSFAGKPDGARPDAGLVMDSAGNLYGTTSYGGASNAGTVFKVDTSNTETVLYSFTGGADGAYPYSSGLVMDSVGNLYGTTYKGGTANLGTVFKVDQTGAETVLHSFGGPDGGFPFSGVIMDNKGNFYGTTVIGGAHDRGTVFAVDAGGNYTLLYSFAGWPDGATPGAGLVRDASGNLYGTTVTGGSRKSGTVFKVSGKGNETVLHSFKFSTDGAKPNAGLIIDGKGNLFGTTSAGGASGAGTVFELTP